VQLAREKFCYLIVARPVLGCCRWARPQADVMVSGLGWLGRPADRVEDLLALLVD
jgi:hypothetical protein